MLRAALAGLALLAGSVLAQPTFGLGRVTFVSGSASHSLTVEVADTPQAQSLGLMYRNNLGENEGMIFVYDFAVRGAFWMKNTLIPLSIAFYDEEWRIVRILDMEPCLADPCPVYDPGVAYLGAVEVNQSYFATRGITPGWRVVFERDR
jgi:uncharacterized protein